MCCLHCVSQRGIRLKIAIVYTKKLDCCGNHYLSVQLLSLLHTCVIGAHLRYGCPFVLASFAALQYAYGEEVDLGT